MKSLGQSSAASSWGRSPWVWTTLLLLLVVTTTNDGGWVQAADVPQQPRDLNLLNRIKELLEELYLKLEELMVNTTTTEDPRTPSSTADTGTPSSTEETGTHSSTVETNTHSSTQETGRPSSTEETGTPSSTAETGTHSSTEETNTHSSTQETGRPSSTEETGTPSSTEETGTPSSTEEIGTPSSTEETGTHSNTEETDSNSSTEETGTPSSTEDTGIPSSTEDTGIPSSTEDTGTPSSTEETGTNSSTEETGTPSSTKETGTPSSTEETGTPSSTEETGTPSSTEETGTPSSTEETGTPSSTDETGTSSSTEETGTPSSTEETGTPSSTEETGTPSSTEDTGTSSSTENTGTPSSTEETGTPSSTEETGTKSGGEILLATAMSRKLLEVKDGDVCEPQKNDNDSCKKLEEVIETIDDITERLDEGEVSEEMVTDLNGANSKMDEVLENKDNLKIDEEAITDKIDASKENMQGAIDNQNANSQILLIVIGSVGGFIVIALVGTASFALYKKKKMSNMDDKQKIKSEYIPDGQDNPSFYGETVTAQVTSEKQSPVEQQEVRTYGQPSHLPSTSYQEPNYSSSTQNYYESPVYSKMQDPVSHNAPKRTSYRGGYDTEANGQQPISSRAPAEKVQRTSYYGSPNVPTSRPISGTNYVADHQSPSRPTSKSGYDYEKKPNRSGYESDIRVPRVAPKPGTRPYSTTGRSKDDEVNDPYSLDARANVKRVPGTGGLRRIDN